MTADTAWSHHTPKVLTEADAAADLAGLPRAVSSEGARAHADFLDFGGHEKPANLIRTLVSERDALAGRVAELEAARDAAAKRAPDFAEFVDETDSTLEMVKRTFGNRGTPPDMLEGFATLTMVEQLLKQCEQVRAALTTPESKP